MNTLYVYEAIRMGWRLMYFSLALDLSHLALQSVLYHLRGLRNLMENKMEEIVYAPMNITHIPEFLKCPAFYRQAVQGNEYILEYISGDFMTPELYLEVSISTSRIAKYIPENLLTPEFCTELVEHNANVIQYLDYTKIPQSTLLHALKEDPKLIVHVQNDPNLCLLAVRHDGLFLGLIPRKLITKEMCFEAITNDPQAWSYVPYEFLALKN